MRTVFDKTEDAPEAIRGELQPLEGGGYYLPLDDVGEGTRHPAVGALARGKQRESVEHAALKETHAKLTTELASVRQQLRDRLTGKVDKSDLEALEADYKRQLAELDTTKKASDAQWSASLSEVLVTREAQKIAAAIAVDADAASLLAEHIAKRLKAEIDDKGHATTRVLDAEGKPSAATVEALSKEIATTKRYSALVLASKASGSGAASAVGSGAPKGTVDWLRSTPDEVAEAALGLIEKGN